MPTGITVGPPSPPWLQGVDQLCPGSCERSGGFCTIPVAVLWSNHTLFPSLLSGLVQSTIILTFKFSHIYYYKPFLSFKSCFLSYLFSQCSQIVPVGIHPFLFFPPREPCILLNSCHHLLLIKSYGCVPRNL